MIKVTKRDSESGERLLKRFSGHVKSKGLLKKFRALRYNIPKPKLRKIRKAAIVREKYRAENKKKSLLVRS